MDGSEVGECLLGGGLYAAQDVKVGGDTGSGWV